MSVLSKITMLFSLVVFCCALASAVQSQTTVGPYPVAAGWTYFLEGVRTEQWPNCKFRFLSYPSPKCDGVNLWNGVGDNQMFEFVSPVSSLSSSMIKKSLQNSSLSSFSLRASNCGQDYYLAYSSIDCNDISVSLMKDPSSFHGVFEERSINSTSGIVWEFHPVNDAFGEYKIVAVDRERQLRGCNASYLSFHRDCTTTSGPGAVFLSSDDRTNSSFGKEQQAIDHWRPAPAAAPAKKKCHSCRSWSLR